MITSILIGGLSLALGLGAIFLACILLVIIIECPDILFLIVLGVCIACLAYSIGNPVVSYVVSMY